MVESYIRDEFDKIENCDELDEIGCSVDMPNEFNPYNWIACFIGPETSAYHGGLFRLSIEFPKDYPLSKPSVYFKTTMYHPNVKDDGFICVDSLRLWNKERSMIEVFISIYNLLLFPNPNSPYNEDAANLMKNDISAFNKKVNEYVRKYALV